MRTLAGGTDEQSLSYELNRARLRAFSRVTISLSMLLITLEVIYLQFSVDLSRGPETLHSCQCVCQFPRTTRYTRRAHIAGSAGAEWKAALEFPYHTYEFNK